MYIMMRDGKVVYYEGVEGWCMMRVWQGSVHYDEGVNGWCMMWVWNGVCDEGMVGRCTL